MCDDTTIKTCTQLEEIGWAAECDPIFDAWLCEVSKALSALNAHPSAMLNAAPNIAPWQHLLAAYRAGVAPETMAMRLTENQQGQVMDVMPLIELVEVQYAPAMV